MYAPARHVRSEGGGFASIAMHRHPEDPEAGEPRSGWGWAPTLDPAGAREVLRGLVASGA